MKVYGFCRQFSFLFYIILLCLASGYAQTVIHSDGTVEDPIMPDPAPETQETEAPSSAEGLGVENPFSNLSGFESSSATEDSSALAEGLYAPGTVDASASILGAQPTLKTPSPVHGLCWSNGDKLFGLTEQNAIFIRDGADNHLVHTIGFDGALDLQFSWDVVTQTDMFMALSNGGRLSVWNFNDLPPSMVTGEPEPSYSVQLENTRRVTASAFSHSGNHMAVAFDDATISMSIVLHYTQKISDKTLFGHLGHVYSLDFSKNDGFLLSAGRDDKLIIWNATDGSKVNELRFYSGSGAPALFTRDSKAIISLETRNLITVRSFDGRRILEIVPNGQNVKWISLTGDGESLAVLTGDDNIELYRLSTGEYYGYVPPFNESTLTSYAFSSTDEYLLTGHADGSVYKLRLKNVLLRPGEKPPKMRLVGADEVVVKGSEWTEGIRGSKKKQDEATVTFPQENSISLGVLGRLFPAPYAFGFDFDAKVRFVFKHTPLYVGGGFTAGIGFPGNSFPYDYKIAGSMVSPPFLLSGTFYAPVGIQVKLGKKAPRMFAEFDPGLRMQKLAQRGSGQTAASKWFFSFDGAVMVGVGWKYFEAAVGAEYDSILGFWPRIGVAGRIPFGKKNGSPAKPDKKEAPEGKDDSSKKSPANGLNDAGGGI